MTDQTMCPTCGEYNPRIVGVRYLEFYDRYKMVYCTDDFHGNIYKDLEALKNLKIESMG